MALFCQKIFKIYSIYLFPACHNIIITHIHPPVIAFRPLQRPDRNNTHYSPLTTHASRISWFIKCFSVQAAWASRPPYNYRPL